MKRLYIIGGCNGAGKTTASFNILPEILDCKEFVNADEIARGLSPFQPESVSIEAGRIMLNRIEELIKSDTDFAFETTLSTRSFVHTINAARSKGYFVTLIFLWLDSVQLAKSRVAKRVDEGGHFIEEGVIQRRYYSGLRNLFELYLPIVDVALIYDNSKVDSLLIAEKTMTGNLIVTDEVKLNIIKRFSNDR
jgi:predicted ABC-type ATPase